MAWGATLLFFQLVLLAGYAVVDTALRRGGARVVGITQVSLLLLATAALIASRPFEAPPGHPEVTFGLALRLLALNLGLPVLALTLTAPAVQARVAADRGPEDRSVYRLYAASNAGSFAGLLAYPWLVEPVLPISAQWDAWRAGFGVLLVACLLLWGVRPPRAGVVLGPRGDSPVARERTWWVLRAALPAVLLAGVSEYLTRDIAPIPLLWVVPLGLYLLTWVVAFAAWGRGLVSLAGRMQDLVAIAAVIILLAQPHALAGPLIALVALVVVGLVQHGALAASAPATPWLGRFYVHLAAGGALGTAVVVFLGPTFLPLPVEGPIALVVAVAAGVPAAAVWTPGGERRFALFALFAVLVPFLGGWSRVAVLGSLSILGGVLAVRWRVQPRRAGLALAGLIAVDSAVRLADPDWVGGDHSVLGRFTVRRDTHGIRLVSGSTLHGLEEAAATGRPRAALYYSRNGPFGDLVRLVEARGPAPAVGVVGLGIGALSCTASPAARLTYFELNPGVVRLARDTTLFRTLSACSPGAPIHLGDARLTLARVADRFDLLVLDAFSSDAIPTHLLTREAFALYRARTAGGGMIAYHVSNRFLNLAPVLAALAAEVGWVAVQSRPVPRPAESSDGPPAPGTDVVVLAADPATVRDLASGPYWAWASPGSRVWTDDWTPLASALVLGRQNVVGR